MGIARFGAMAPAVGANGAHGVRPCARNGAARRGGPHGGAGLGDTVLAAPVAGGVVGSGLEVTAGVTAEAFAGGAVVAVAGAEGVVAELVAVALVAVPVAGGSGLTV